MGKGGKEIVTYDETEYVEKMVEETKQRHEEELKTLRGKIDGIPERMDNIETRIETLSTSIADFINELRKGYVSKELCEVCRRNIKVECENNTYNIKVLTRLFWGAAAVITSGLLGVILNRLNLV